MASLPNSANSVSNQTGIRMIKTWAKKRAEDLRMVLTESSVDSGSSMNGFSNKNWCSWIGLFHTGIPAGEKRSGRLVEWSGREKISA